MAEDTKIIQVNGSPVTLEYISPTIGGLEEVAKVSGVMEALQAHCKVMVTVDGALKPLEWWKKVPELEFYEAVEFMSDHRPPAPKNSVAASLPLVWGP